MNIQEYTKVIRKDYIYEVYTNVIKNPKEYEKITRKKMCLDIIKYMSDVTHLTCIISYPEYQALIHLLNNQYQKNEQVIYEQLRSRLIVVFNFYTKQYEVLDEYKETLQKLLPKIDIKTLKERQELDEYIPSIIKSYGILSYDHFKNCLEHYLPHIPDIMDIFLHIDYYLQYYSYMVFINNNDILDKRFEYFEDEFIEAYEQFDDVIINDTFIPKTALLSIGKYGLNLKHDASLKLFKQLEAEPMYFQKHILEQLTLYVHLQCIIDEDFFPHMYHDKYQLLPLIQKVAQNLPSAKFHGLSKKQFMKKYKYVKNNNQAKLLKDDAFLFFKIYFGLLEYVNNTYHIQPKLKRIYQQTNLPLPLVIEVRDYLFNHLSVIDNFIFKNPYHFTNEELKLIHDFKYSVSGIFTIMEYDDEYAYLMGLQGNFAVKGLHSTIEEVIPRNALPYTAPMNLIPFKGEIVYDGIIAGMNIQLSKNIIRQFQKEYKNNVTYYSISTDSFNKAS